MIKLRSIGANFFSNLQICFIFLTEPKNTLVCDSSLLKKKKCFASFSGHSKILITLKMSAYSSEKLIQIVGNRRE